MREVITSGKNEKIRHLRMLNTKARLRNEEKCFVAEGLRIYREIPEELLLETYVSGSFAEKHGMPDDHTTVIADGLFHSVSDTKTPQGILAIVRRPSWEAADLLGKERKTPDAPGVCAPLLLVLENVQDPGNVGTMIRTAEGAGATGVILLGHTADPFAPKTIRSTMGSVFRVPLIQTGDREWLKGFLKKEKIPSAAADMDGTADYTDVDYRQGAAFFVGNEGNGLTEELKKQADYLVRIPMEGRVESLNASIAASLLMYEARRQRSAERKKRWI